MLVGGSKADQLRRSGGLPQIIGRNRRSTGGATDHPTATGQRWGYGMASAVLYGRASQLAPLPFLSMVDVLR